MKLTSKDETIVSPKTLEKDWNAEILKLIREKPRRWTELKEITGLSSATLYRYLQRLEKSGGIEKELKEKRLQWKVTKKGRKRAVGDSLSEFVRKGHEFGFDVRMGFSYWEPRKKKDIKQEKEWWENAIKRFHPEDREFFLLHTNETRKALLKAVGKELIEQFRKAKPSANIAITPKIIVLKQPRSAYKLSGLVEEITELLDKNKEKIISWLLPKKTTKYKDGNYFTNEALILFKIDFEVKEKIIDEILEKAKGGSVS